VTPQNGQAPPRHVQGLPRTCPRWPWRTETRLYGREMVWREDGEPVELEELAAESRVLLFFYLFDWSRT